MSHMQAQMTKKLSWLEIDGPMGTRSRHARGRRAADRARRLKRRSRSPSRSPSQIVKGYGVRSSAPGYMDATPWSVYASLKDARKAYVAEKRAVRGED